MAKSGSQMESNPELVGQELECTNPERGGDYP